MNGLEPPLRPRIAAVAGPSCSGKTTLSLRLAAALGGAPVLSLDRYYRDLGGLDPGVRALHNFDHPGALDSDLLIRHVRELAEGRPVDAPEYDFSAHVRRPQRRRIEPRSWIIVEGLHALHWPELIPLYRVTVFVDADHELCLSRRIERDVRERGREPAGVRRQYETTVRPMCDRFVAPARSRAGFIVNGGLSPEEMAAAALSAFLGV